MKDTSKDKGIVIIVEGVDKAGKTTLMEKMTKAIPGIVIKLTQRPKTADYRERALTKTYWLSVLEYMNLNRNKIIHLDRFYISELCYSKIKRGYEAWEDPDYQHYERVIGSHNHLVLYCDPGEEVIMERLKREGDEHVVEDDMKALIKRYDEYFSKTDLSWIKVNTSKTVEENIEIIIQVLEKEYEYKRNN